ncbi:hypothetical protein HC956_00825 [Alcaligenes faecalis]|uniref:Uncharacterized protein n=1 Tax=Alcaligenes ammonioxydans TaxID=2582914 RepID=A0ABX8SNU6_9BURK|nr:DUF4286 family protein [Alcaligenes ammonioxydans]QBH19690.1 hypothetical protein EYC51_09345 [Alcaligenes faecalis]QXX77701.1 hypothetical protein FE795_00825 [Alcaligenes ammonioxydans]WGQ35743.1 hypothetical protein QEZ63_00905 [Alcaligenes faecalis]
MSAIFRTDRDAPGELFIWTDIAPEHERDFNQWYEREHMAERAAIPGFQWSRRYVRQGVGRKYLALYRTESLRVFGTPEYRKAFEQQTDWSNINFARMSNTQRRVMAVSVLGGAGTGSHVLLVRLPERAHQQSLARHSAAYLEQVDGLVALRVLTPDPELSTPLPSEDTQQRRLDPYLVADLTTPEAAHVLAARLQQDLGVATNDVSEFSLLWDLQSRDLNASRS